jgi:hypothetical protein
MLRHQGGDHVKAGFYFNLDSWDVNTISGTEGGTLTGSGEARYLRVPAIGMLALAPLLGAAFAMFLPFIGIVMVAQYAAARSWQGARQAAHATIATLGPSWQPTAAHLAGTPGDQRKDAAQNESPAAAARLDSLEREIADKAERTEAGE